MGPWVCVWLADFGLGEARNRRAEAGSRMEARAMRLRQGEVIRQWRRGAGGGEGEESCQDQVLSTKDMYLPQRNRAQE